MSISNLCIIFIFFIQPLQAFAQDSKFQLDGATLIYDTAATDNEDEQEITWDDVDELEGLLKSNEEIQLLELNSSGGDLEAAFYMSDVIIDYELDTIVKGTCESACTIVFLAGETRNLERGSWIGFHQAFWDAEFIEDYYERYKESDGWSTPFDFASWLYSDTQEEVLRYLEYFVERGVDAGFSITTMKANSDEMWYPRRKELEAANVLSP